MTTESRFPPIDIPDTDIWDFLFQRKREFLDSNGMVKFPLI
jgi:hypothetical protein